VKFQSASAASRRDTMRNRQRLKRIGAPTLRTRYPGLDSMQLDFGFSDASEFVPSPQVTVYHPPAPAYFSFACPYSDCDGEFDLASQVESAIGSRDSRSSGTLRCTGTRHRDVACTLCLDYSISPKRR
jgi:hypothetical protein